MIKKFIALSLILLVFTVVPSNSQQITEGLVVSTCGTPGRTLTAGQNGPVTMDTTGVVCSGNNGGGGGLSNVNVVEWDTTALGAPTVLGTNPTGNVIGTNSAVSVTPTATNPTSTLTLPSTTTAYTAGQLIASSATAGSVVVPFFSIVNTAGAAIIPRLRLYSSDTTSTSWGTQTIQVDLWTAAPTFTNGDRGTFSPATGTATHIAAYTCTMSAVYGDGVYGECIPVYGNFSLPKLASGTSIFWSLIASSGSGVTGASKVFTVAAELLN